MYPCFCSPDELAASRAAMLKQGCPPRYSGKCAVLAQSAAAAKIAQGEAAAIRFRMPTAEFIFEDLVHGRKVFRGKDIGDFIIRRASGGFSFFFANAVDDADCGVSHVLRGDDHLANTPRQLALITALSVYAAGLRSYRADDKRWLAFVQAHRRTICFFFTRNGRITRCFNELFGASRSPF